MNGRALGLTSIERLKKTRKWAIESRKTTTEVITLANHKTHRQYSEPIKTQNNYM